MSGISFMGVGSGLPVNDIIRATLAAEATPLKRLENDKNFFRSQISAIGQLTSRLSSLRTAMLDLRGLDKFSILSSKAANEKLFTATADHLAGATAGNYNIQVLAEARSYREVMAPVSTTEFLSGEVTIAGKTITIGDGWTLDRLRQEINADNDLKDKVSANLVNVGNGEARLVLNARQMGEEGRFISDFSDLSIRSGTRLSASSAFNNTVTDGDGKITEQTRSSGYIPTGAQFDVGTISLKGTADDGTAFDLSFTASGKSLADLAAEISASDHGFTATVVADPEDATKERLEITRVDPDADSSAFTFSFNNVIDYSDTEAPITKDTTLSSPDIVALQQAVDDAQAALTSPDPTPAEIAALEAAQLALENANLDARIKIDGIEASSSTNTFSNVISGVTINITQGAMNEAIKTSTLEVKRDDKAIKDNIDKFVKAYNDVIIHLNEAKKGSLYGDSTVRSVESELRNILYTPTPSSLDPSDPDFAQDTQKNFLAIIGIEVFSPRTFDPENPDSQRGTLRVNQSRLTEMLTNDFDRVAHIIGASSFIDDNQPDGYAARFADLAQRLTSTTVQDGQLRKGLLEIRREGLNNEVKRVDARIDSTNMRLELLEERLVRQFSAIEGLISGMNSTGMWIGQQLSSLPGYTRPSK
ncbi:flagellar filament capping protein FliD [Marinospirillum alkaliphilum]|uniref:Flagellar hook-associated protein 2 n=1 Tax=Marinospirillum alkaliphilum DSM 21637 TaxID=1122209 RepID=A0A1K1VJA1_9GAMM|nr:flagellar filament capping protein FliD [Marinospirillum alkaliphilum]SFX24851.1 Flagellar capping protein FliD [Marinospirillum alkaliphilum DSM 21637]